MNNRLNVILASGFPLLLIGTGLVIIYLLWWHSSFSGTFARTAWKRTPCVIERSEIGSKEREWRIPAAGITLKFREYDALVTYRYRVDSEEYQSDWFDVKGEPMKWYCIPASTEATLTHVRKCLHAHRAGSKTVCFVNPKNPRQAVLYRDRGIDFPAGQAVIALLFIFSGSFIIYSLNDSAIKKRKPSRIRILFRISAAMLMCTVVVSIGIILSYSGKAAGVRAWYEKSRVKPLTSGQPEPDESPLSTPSPYVEPFVDGIITGVVEEKTIIVKKTDGKSVEIDIEKAGELVPRSWQPGAGEKVRIYYESPARKKVLKIVREDHIEKPGRGSGPSEKSPVP